MLGGLFNRKAQEIKIERMQARITELEYETKSLAERHSKQTVRAKKAVSEKQAADLALKNAEKKIETLERELKQQGPEEQNAVEPGYKNAITLTNARTSDLMFQMGSIRSRNDDLLSVYLRPGETISDLAEFERMVELDELVKYVLARIESPTGIALFCDMKRRGLGSLIVALPFPIRDTTWQLDCAFDTGQMQDILAYYRDICIVLAHAGETIIVVSDQEAVIDHKIIRSSVKEKHTKGGMSQRRFERLRDEDIRHHGEKARDGFEALVAEYKNELKLVVASGEPSLVKEITQGCSIPVISRSIDPKAKIEKQNIDKIRVLAWSSRWYVV